MEFANRLVILIFTATIFLSCSNEEGLGGQASPTFEKRPRGTAYSDQGYIEYLPKGYGGRLALPLLIFFHGLNHNGDGEDRSLDRILESGPTYFINKGEWPEDRRFVVLAPQQGSSCPTADQIRKFIEFAIDHYKVNPNQVHLTGISCGAMGIASYLSKYGGDKITAVIPVAGNIAPAWSAQQCNFANDVAIWTFNGEHDPNYAADNQAMQNFISCPQPRKDMRFTAYPGANHAESWAPTYSNPDVYSWLLDQREL